MKWEISCWGSFFVSLFISYFLFTLSFVASFVNIISHRIHYHLSRRSAVAVQANANTFTEIERTNVRKTGTDTDTDCTDNDCTYKVHKILHDSHNFIENNDGKKSALELREHKHERDNAMQCSAMQ